MEANCGLNRKGAKKQWPSRKRGPNQLAPEILAYRQSAEKLWANGGTHTQHSQEPKPRSPKSGGGAPPQAQQIDLSIWHTRCDCTTRYRKEGASGGDSQTHKVTVLSRRAEGFTCKHRVTLLRQRGKGFTCSANNKHSTLSHEQSPS